MSDKDSFNAGYLIAVANIMHLHGDDVIATDVLRQLGVVDATPIALGLTEYDCEVLAPLFGYLARDETPLPPLIPPKETNPYV